MENKLRLEFLDEHMVSDILNSDFEDALKSQFGAIPSGNRHCCFAVGEENRISFKDDLLNTVASALNERRKTTEFSVTPDKSPLVSIVDADGETMVWEVDSSACSK